MSVAPEDDEALVKVLYKSFPWFVVFRFGFWVFCFLSISIIIEIKISSLNFDLQGDDDDELTESESEEEVIYSKLYMYDVLCSEFVSHDCFDFFHLFK
jgi:hypothetical protein